VEGAAIDPEARVAADPGSFAPDVNTPKIGNPFKSDDSKKEDLEDAKDKQLTAMVHKARTVWAFKAIFVNSIAGAALAAAIAFPGAWAITLAMLGSLAVLLSPGVPIEWKIAAGVTIVACIAAFIAICAVGAIPFYGWGVGPVLMVNAAIMTTCVGFLLSMNAMALNDWSKQTFDLDHEGSVAQKLEEVDDLAHYSVSFEEIERVKFTFYREALYILGEIDGVSWKDILGEGSIKAKEINDEMDTRYKYPEAYQTYGDDPDGTKKTWIEYIREHEDKIIEAVSKESPKFREVWPDFCERFDLSQQTGRPNDGRYEPATAAANAPAEQTQGGSGDTPDAATAS
jgi:hypothetical protein